MWETWGRGNNGNRRPFIFEQEGRKSLLASRKSQQSQDTELTKFRQDHLPFSDGHNFGEGQLLIVGTSVSGTVTPVVVDITKTWI